MMISYFPSSSTLTFCLYAPHFLSLLLIIHYLSLLRLCELLLLEICVKESIFFTIGHRVVVAASSSFLINIFLYD